MASLLQQLSPQQLKQRSCLSGGSGVLLAAAIGAAATAATAMAAAAAVATAVALKNKSGCWSMADERKMEKSCEIKRMVHQWGEWYIFLHFF